MIPGFIIVCSVVLALVFACAWLLRPDLRRRIEAPKHAFADRLQAYNRQVDHATESTEPRNDEPG